jgi:SAM-dependent methyltransferase
VVSGPATDRPAAEPTDPPTVVVSAGELDAVEPDGFDLLACFGPLEEAADADVLVSRLADLRGPGGIVVASVRGPLATAGGEPAVAALERRFAEVRRLGSGAIVAAGDEALGDLEPPSLPSEEPPVAMLAAALDEWEERAREAEAEAAAVQWEGRVAGERLTAVVNRLYELENTPARRLLRRLRGQREVVSHGAIARGGSGRRTPK